MLRVLVIALVMLVAAMMLMPHPEPQTATVIDPPRALPEVNLIDQDGEPFSLDRLHGRPALVFFGFTNCPDICPLTLAVIADALDTIRERASERAPNVLFVSVDPDRDTPAKIREYLVHFDPLFIGVTGDENALAPLFESLAVTVHKESLGNRNYNVTHNGAIYVLDRKGRWAAVFGGQSHESGTLVQDYFLMHSNL